MRRWSVLTVLVLLLFSGLVGSADDTPPPAGWTEVKGGYKKQAYAVSFPPGGRASDSEDSIITKYGQVRIFRTVWEKKGGPLYAAGQILLPPDLTKAPIKVRQEFFRDMFLEEVRGRLVEEKKATLGTMAGKEYVAETPNGMARYRLLGTGVQIFRLVAIGTKEQLQAKEVETFFDSFKRTPAVEKKDK